MGVGFSIGVIQLHNAVGSIDDLLGMADERMYEAKAAKTSGCRPVPAPARSAPLPSVPA